MSTKLVVTHSGPFHADDVMAVSILYFAYRGEEDELIVERTRDPERIGVADIVMDVGGKFCQETDRFDHHQPDPPIRPSGAPYSSAGLVWRKYGFDACVRHAAMTDEVARVVIQKVDEELILSIDLLDNGAIVIPEGITTFSGAISLFNPAFGESRESGDFDQAFDRAVKWASWVLTRTIQSCLGRVLSKNLVQEAISQSKDGIIVLTENCQWTQSLFEIEEELGHMAGYWMVYQSPDKTWMVQAIPPTLGSFTQRIPLPESWAGLRDSDLDKETGILGCVFTHRGRFIGGHRTREGAIEMARRATEIASGSPTQV